MSVDPLSCEFNRTLLAKLGRMKCRIVSDSMEPLLRVGDVVEIEPAKIEVLRRFDILVFQQYDKMLCHFLWNKNSTGKHPSITTRSLKKPRADDLPITPDLLLGRVVDRKLSGWTIAKIILCNLSS